MLPAALTARERRLLGAALVVAVLAVLLVFVLPGALADPTDRGPVRPGAVQVADLAIAEENVTGDRATLRVSTALAHRGNPTPNVTVRFRATDSESGLLTTTETVDVGNLEGESERTATANLTVPREGGYRVEAVVYSNDRRLDAGSRTVSGLAALTPPRARSTVRFATRGALPPLSVAVENAGSDRTRLNVSAALENGGDRPVSDLALTIVVRQAESNIVAARAQREIGQVRPGRTDETALSVSVPAGYNYYVDAVLERDGVVIDTARTTANLDPRRTLDADVTETEVEFDAGDFEAGDGRPRPRPTGTPAATSAAGPGFGPETAFVAVALVATLALARRWTE